MILLYHLNKKAYRTNL